MRRGSSNNAADCARVYSNVHAAHCCESVGDEHGRQATTGLKVHCVTDITDVIASHDQRECLSKTITPSHHRPEVHSATDLTARHDPTQLDTGGRPWQRRKQSFGDGVLEVLDVVVEARRPLRAASAHASARACTSRCAAAFRACTSARTGATTLKDITALDGARP